MCVGGRGALRLQFAVLGRALSGQHAARPEQAERMRRGAVACTSRVCSLSIRAMVRPPGASAAGS